MADTFGRLKALFASLVIVFLGGLTSAFTFQNWVVFNVLRGFAGFGIGGSTYLSRSLCDIFHNDVDLTLKRSEMIIEYL